MFFFEVFVLRIANATNTYFFDYGISFISDKCRYIFRKIKFFY